MKKIWKFLKRTIARLMNNGGFRREFLGRLPQEYHGAAMLAFLGKINMSAEERKLGARIESFRAQIPQAHPQAKIESYATPRSSTFGLSEDNGHALPGPVQNTKIVNAMKTGSGIYKGILLRRIVQGTGARRVLELGTHMGFSGSYFLSAGNTELVTIEGSAALCAIAERNMRRISTNFNIVNSLFDEAIDKLVAANEKFDCIYIDGQHEREATLHYTQRLLPLMAEGAICIYDDIYWSNDMNRAWNDLPQQSVFSEGVDLFSVGIAKSTSGSSGMTLYDLGDYLPRPRTYRGEW